MYPAHRLLLLVRGRNRIKSESLGGAGDLHSLTRLNFTVDQSATQKRKTRGESGNPKSWREGGPKKDSRILLVPPLSCFFFCSQHFDVSGFEHLRGHPDQDYVDFCGFCVSE